MEQNEASEAKLVKTSLLVDFTCDSKGNKSARVSQHTV